jgi:hypothetical protein
MQGVRRVYAKLSRLRGLRASRLTVVLGLVLALPPSAARATYTGVQDATTLGKVAAGGDWIAVPQYEDNSDPGSIDGTPFDNTTSSLEVARVSGPRRISFRSVSPSSSLAMGPMLVAGARKVLAVAWTDATGTGQVDDATLNASGNLPDPLVQTGTPSDGSLRLSVGQDGAYALSWRDGLGVHAMAAPAGAQRPSALLGSDVALDPADRVVLAGGDSFWLVKVAAGGLSAAPGVFGQVTAPLALTVGGAIQATALGDDAGGLWMLAREHRGLLAVHIDRTGLLRSTPLPAGVTHPLIALAGTTAVIAYNAGGRCTAYIERLRSGSAARMSVARTALGSRARACSTPKGIAVDPASATAYVLMRSGRGMTLATETAARRTSSWRGRSVGVSTPSSPPGQTVWSWRATGLSTTSANSAAGPTQAPPSPTSSTCSTRRSSSARASWKPRL